MNAADVMSRPVETIHSDASLSEAADKMRVLGVGMLPVCGYGDEIVGVITDRDIALRAVAAGRDPLVTAASDVMTPEVVSCFEHTPIEEALRLMEDEDVRRLVVVAADNRPVGVISLADLATALDDAAVADLLRALAEPRVAPRAAASV